jgi:hypothetical protein
MDFIDQYLAERRTLDQAVANLRATYAWDPDPNLADMIRQGEAEILDRIRAANSRRD